MHGDYIIGKETVTIGSLCSLKTTKHWLKLYFEGESTAMILIETQYLTGAMTSLLQMQ